MGFALRSAGNDNALLAELARFVEYWAGSADLAAPELPSNIPAAVGVLVSMNESRSYRPFNADDHPVTSLELHWDDDGNLFFVDVHQFGKVVCATQEGRDYVAQWNEGSAVTHTIDSLSRYIVSFVLQQLVFTSAKRLDEVDLLPVCEKFNHPLELIWDDVKLWADVQPPVSIYLCNNQFLTIRSPDTETFFSGYKTLAPEFRASIKAVYPKLRDKYLR